MRSLSMLVAGGVVVVGSSTALAQTCVVQTQLPGLGLGRSSAASAPDPLFATTWDVDGSGPAPERLVMPRGAYLNEGVTQNNELVVLGGTAPEYLPPPADGVLASATSVGTDLYAIFIVNSVGTLMRWDGTQWQSVAMPAFNAMSRAQIASIGSKIVLFNISMGSENTAIYDTVSGTTVTTRVSNANARLVRTGSEIYAVGSVTFAGVNRGIARLENNQWVTIDDNSEIRPSGVTGVARDGSRLFATFDAPGNQDGLYELTPAGWQLIAQTGFNSTSFSLQLHLLTTPDGVVVVKSGALQTFRDGQFIASTQPLVRNVSGIPANIRFLTVWNGKAIFATDAISEQIVLGTPPATSIDHFAANVSSVAMTDGRNVINITGGFDNIVNQFIDFQGTRYAVGYFRSVDGQVARYIARSLNGQWTSLPTENAPTGGIIAAEVLGDSLAVLWHELDAFGATPRVSLWDGSTWRQWPALSRGFMARGLVAFEGKLHTVRRESVPFSPTVPVIYRSEGQTWEPMVMPSSRTSGPVLNGNGTVERIGGSLVYQDPRGSFVRQGNNWIEQIASDSGKPVAIVDSADGTPLAVNADGTYVRGARGWVVRAPRTTLLNRTVSVNVNGELIVAFRPPLLSSGDRVTLSSWNGATWVQREVIVGISTRPLAMAFETRQQDPQAVTLARDAATGGVMVGGPFLSASNRHDFQVLLGLTPRIVFSDVPVDTRIQPGRTAVLAVEVASAGSFTYQWTRDGVAVSDGTLATGEVISGATTATLTITGATGAVNGMYACTVTPVTAGVYCNSETTAPVMLTAERFCDSIDFNNNTVFPEDQDVIEFFGVLAGGECAVCNDIDFNNDAIFPDGQDVIDFFNVLAGGECP